VVDLDISLEKYLEGAIDRKIFGHKH